MATKIAPMTDADKARLADYNTAATEAYLKIVSGMEADELSVLDSDAERSSAWITFADSVWPIKSGLFALIPGMDSFKDYCTEVFPSMEYSYLVNRVNAIHDCPSVRRNLAAIGIGLAVKLAPRLKSNKTTAENIKALEVAADKCSVVTGRDRIAARKALQDAIAKATPPRGKKGDNDTTTVKPVDLIIPAFAVIPADLERAREKLGSMLEAMVAVNAAVKELRAAIAKMEKPVQAVAPSAPVTRDMLMKLTPAQLAHFLETGNMPHDASNAVQMAGETPKRRGRPAGSKNHTNVAGVGASAG